MSHFRLKCTKFCYTLRDKLMNRYTIVDREDQTSPELAPSISRALRSSIQVTQINNVSQPGVDVNGNDSDKV